MGKLRKNSTANQSANRTARTSTSDQSIQNVESGERKALIDSNTYKQLYSGMLRCRMVEERACAVLGRQKAATVCKHAIGQEASAVGTIAVLRHEDTVAPSGRNWVATIAGEPLKNIFEQFRSANSGNVSARDLKMSDVSAAATIETQAAVATGLALAQKLNNKPGVVLALAADGWADSDGVRDTLKFAARNKLPIIYVVNSGDIVVPESRLQPDRVTTIAHSCGVTAITVDGTDAVAVYRVASESINRARMGVGPTLIDCRFIPDPPRGDARRTLRRLRHVDPLIHMENYMRKRNAWSDAWKEALVKRFTREIDAAVKVAQRHSDKATGKRRRPKV